MSLPLPERIAQKLAGSARVASAAPAATPTPTAPVAATEPPPEPGTVVAPATPEPAPAVVVRGRPTAVRTILTEPAKAMPTRRHDLVWRSSTAPVRPVPTTRVTTPPPTAEPTEASAGSGKQGGLVRMM